MTIINLFSVAFLFVVARIGQSVGWRVGDRLNIFRPPSKSPTKKKKDDKAKSPTRQVPPWYIPVDSMPTPSPTRYSNRWTNPSPRTPEPTRAPVRSTPSPSRRLTPSPSKRPTPQPTRSPTPMPTARPVAPPSPTPSRSPTRQPSPEKFPTTAKPASYPTARPQRAPTGQPVSIAPPLQTLPPDNFSSSPVAHSPGSSTTRSPTTGEGTSTSCTSNGNSFGSADGDPRFLVYGYQIETNPNIIVGSLADDVLPPLEQAFVDFLLPQLFPQTCPELDTLPSRRGLRVVGVTATPNDEPRPEIACRGTVATGNTCVFVRGSLLVFVDENEIASVLERQVRHRLKLGMDNGVFLTSHPSIRRLTYVETDANGLPIVVSDDSNQNSTDTDVQIEDDSVDSDNDLVFPIIMAAAACIVIALGAVTARRFS